MRKLEFDPEETKEHLHKREQYLKKVFTILDTILDFCQTLTNDCDNRLNRCVSSYEKTLLLFLVNLTRNYKINIILESGCELIEKKTVYLSSRGQFYVYLLKSDFLYKPINKKGKLSHEDLKSFLINLPNKDIEKIVNDFELNYAFNEYQFLLQIRSLPIELFEEIFECYIECICSKDNIYNWKSLAFTNEEIVIYLDKDLKENDYSFAQYLRGNGYQIEGNRGLDYFEREYDNWIQSEKEIHEYLGIMYPVDIRGRMRKLDIINNWITTVSFIINGNEWENLKEIFLEGIHCQISLSNCSQLLKVCFDNILLKELEISNCPFITSISVRDNELDCDLSVFSFCVKLKFLDVSYNMFKGDLVSLERLVNLKKLNIQKNEISSVGWKLLSSKLEHFYTDELFIPELEEYIVEDVKYVFGDYEKFGNCKYYNFKKWKINY